MNCPRGHGEMKERLVSLCFCDRAVPAKIVDVPAFVCPVCDDRFHTFPVAKNIEWLKDRLGVPDRTVTMNIVEYREVGRTSDNRTAVESQQPLRLTATDTRVSA